MTPYDVMAEEGLSLCPTFCPASVVAVDGFINRFPNEISHEGNAVKCCIGAAGHSKCSVRLVSAPQPKPRGSPDEG